MSQRIGILGGTFNPIHVGHLIIAQLVLEKVRLDKVIFVPSNVPPHKKEKNILPGKDRLRMCRLAAKGNSLFQVSDVEIKRAGKSYTVDTLEYFRETYPKGTKFYFIIGADHLESLASWKRIKDVLKIARFIVVDRYKYKKRSSSIKYTVVPIPLIEISSSQLRQRIVQGRDVNYFIPKGVVKYIQENKLYQN